ncbi:PrsW family intramembrane metalloprotease [Frondihabitans sp. VKM Ac-2883]|uniref:PrsW family intramembrane metalloprotease n=1 Tax=Frondihabitans sp. VKM Ac-2883 TaxID=2783823 RepID=UPI00188ABA3F|nr:PrsW family intramembrane metalloprotease [Frondihabitans sp. VKM Ac-2883]MBF4576799.1 PrsW family intramembrane metalloprotease [Frondihabitans sp. VKM Ac-2883]
MTRGNSPHPPPALRRRSPATSFAALAVGFVVIACFAAAVVVYFVSVLPTEVLTIGIFLAVVPLVIVLFGIWLVDRWEPEPRVALIFAFFWGAGVSVGAALLFDFAVQTVQSALGASGESETADIVGAVVQAPVVEETAKGVGVLLVLWIFRRTFDGPIDGIVYAATVAAGFAFVENIQYFSVQVVHQAFGGESVAGVFLVRALMAPFGHIIYTACVGFALGVASRRTGPLGALGYFAVGLVPAMLLHALWNGALVVVGDRFLAYYVLVQVPIFVACVVLVVVLRYLERRVTRLRLADYAGAGWFDQTEVAMLSSGASRRRAQRWAKYNGLGPVMAGFISDATRLASTRQKIVSMRHSASGRAAAQSDEQELLAAIASARPYLQAPGVAAAGGPGAGGPGMGQWASRPSGMPAWAEPNPGAGRSGVDRG